jgi:pimeloyl-ACP methyl ester carboxylesterase
MAPQAAATDSPSWRSVRLNVQIARVAGTTIAWAEVGAGSPLVLLNGTASPMSEWDPAFLAGLAAQHRVIVFDYPGLGDSGRAPSAWNFDAASDWVSEFLSQVSPGSPVDVLGWSMGGFIAQRLVVRHPANVRALVLAATNPGGSQAVLGPQWVQDIDSSSSSDADYLRTNYPASGRAAGKRFLDRLNAAVDSGAYPEVDTPDATLEAMVAAEDPWLASDVNLRDLRTITKPTLVITGRQDLITPALNSTRIAAAIPSARLVLVPGAGHSFVFQQPASVTAMINAFLASAR